MIDAMNLGIRVLSDKQSRLLENRGFVLSDITEREQELSDLRDKLAAITQDIEQVSEVLAMLETPIAVGAGQSKDWASRIAHDLLVDR